MQSSLTDLIRDDCREALAERVDTLTPLSETCLLITGGTGFMGTWLAEGLAYLNDHHQFGTRILLLSGRANTFSAKATHLAIRKDVTLIERDVRSLLELPNEVNWIVHAAGNPDNRLHVSDPLRVMQGIVQGTQATLEAATHLPNLKKFLNISSGLVYGPQPLTQERIPEDWAGRVECAAVGAAYPEAKRYAETLCAVYRNQHRLPIVNARPFAFIGPYQLLDRPWAVNNFIRDSLMGGPIRILGDGETVRSYMYPSEMALWLLSILLHGTVGASYNVGSPEGVTLRRLAEAIAGWFPSRIEIHSRTGPDSHLHRSRFVPDVTLAREALGLTIRVDLETAITRTLRWHRAAQQPKAAIA